MAELTSSIRIDFSETSRNAEADHELVLNELARFAMRYGLDISIVTVPREDVPSGSPSFLQKIYSEAGQVADYTLNTENLVYEGGLPFLRQDRLDPPSPPIFADASKRDSSTAARAVRSLGRACRNLDGWLPIGSGKSAREIKLFNEIAVDRNSYTVRCLDLAALNWIVLYRSGALRHIDLLGEVSVMRLTELAAASRKIMDLPTGWEPKIRSSFLA